MKTIGSSGICAVVLALAVAGGCGPKHRSSSGGGGNGNGSQPAAAPAPVGGGVGGGSVVPVPMADLADAGSLWQSNDSSATPGATFAAGGRVINSGPAPSVGFWVDFYASSDDQLDTASDLLIGSVFLPGLAAGASADASLSVVFPAIPPGSWHVGWQIDATAVVAEGVETNNAVVIAGPSLVVRDSFEPNDVMATAWYLGAGGRAYQALGTVDSAADEDWFSFDRDAAGMIQIDLSTLPADYDLELYASDGTLLASSAAIGFASESISLLAPATDLYFVRVYSATGAFVTRVTYQLDLDIQ